MKRSLLIINDAVVAEPRTALVTARFRTNLSNLVRHEKLEGEDHVVVPVIMFVEGVMNNILYSEEEFSKTPAAWNCKPVIVYHPRHNGEPVSACSPEELEARRIGIILNARWNTDKKRLEAEAWLKESRVKKVDQRVWNAIEEGKILENSTGLFLDCEEKEGEFNGKKYSSIGRNFRPDHLAVLPDQIGACSVAEGAGFLRVNARADIPPDHRKRYLEELARHERDFCNSLLRAGIDILETNELSHEETRVQLLEALREKYKDRLNPRTGYLEIHLCAVYDDYVIFEIGYDGHSMRLGYTKNDKGVTLSTGAAQEVVRVVEYRANSGTPSGGSSSTNPKARTIDMNRKEQVDSLITNHGYAANTRDWLMGLTDEQFAPIFANATKVSELSANAAKVAAVKPATTVDEYINNAPAGLQDMLRAGVQAHNDEKARLVAAIIANCGGKDASVYSQAELEVMSVGSLQKLAKATKKEPGTDFSGLASNATGAGATESFDSEPLVRPIFTNAEAK